ncbi:MAG TPA: SpoIIE family protein phosphatase [Bacteroidales bacterium]|nr:SpoIIE family protein phosphatase [Bacteroidales bacterium]HPT01896.1 SpoIIE family protein phosphatase [Bacteroidales bacterium]
MSENQFYVEVNVVHKNHDLERICGDHFLSRRIYEENRIIAVLSDGMGHGVKAAMLSTLTATMAMNLTEEHKDVHRIADIIMNTLPVCSERKMSYSTFTIIDIEIDGLTRILEYDNPQALVFRGNKQTDPDWETITLVSEKNAGKELRTCSFIPQKEDRIVICSDGVTQSGMGSAKYPFGYGLDNMSKYVLDLIGNDSTISGAQLAAKVVNMAVMNDNYRPKDDTSCAVIYFREPRRLLICTGPPYEKSKDAELGETVKNFDGKKIICGATTGDIISRELGVPIVDSFEFDDTDLPPISFMDGIDLVTEGILTLGKVSEILKNYSQKYKPGKGPADQIVRMLLDSDQIHFIIGTRINIAHQDPTLPVELEIRRTVVRRIVRLLEDKFLKEVTMNFI